MERRTFVAGLLAMPAVLAALQACGSESAADPASSAEGTDPGMTTPGSTNPPSPAGVARSDKQRIDATTFDASQAVASINGLSVDLFGELSSQIEPNLVFSAASVAIALAMTRAGALGATATEMDTVLHIGDAATLPMAMNALTTALDGRTETFDVPGDDPVRVVLTVANSLWAQQGLAFETAFLDLLATQFGTGLELVDYKANPEGARQEINTWVDDATEHRIPELLPSGVLTTDSRLTLVNAIYMKAPWQTTFPKQSTAPADFTTMGGAVVQAPTMHLNTHLPHTSGAGWQGVELPYYGSALSMLIVLPDADVDLVVDAGWFATGPAPPKLVNLSLPKFDIETSVGLNDVLKILGMPTAFDPVMADFSAMTTEDKLFIDAVVHQANITVDEDGTEAAAATAVVMSRTSAQIDPPIEFVVDRPFVFAIRDNATGAVLFLGRIGDPTQTRG